MIFIERPETNPHFNIATEEYILKNYSEDVIMLWQCEPSVILGKHQNALAEVNLDLVSESNIPVIRRISGGGTVFHDPGNINYTIITSEKQKDKLIDFRKFTRPIVEFLASYGIVAGFEEKNNLVIDGKKFSGNSAHVHKNRVLHHGTLLFNSDLEKLDEFVKPKSLDIEDKAVKSIRATVTNISDHLDEKMDVQLFKAKLQKHLLKYHKISEVRKLTDADKTAINKLIEEKYRQWQWNYGYSPSFVLKNRIDELSVELTVKNGFIETIDLIGPHDPSIAAALFHGIHYRQKEIEEMLLTTEVSSKDIETCLKLLGF